MNSRRKGTVNLVWALSVVEVTRKEREVWALSVVEDTREEREVWALSVVEETLEERERDKIA